MTEVGAPLNRLYVLVCYVLAKDNWSKGEFSYPPPLEKPHKSPKLVPSLHLL